MQRIEAGAVAGAHRPRRLEAALLVAVLMLTLALAPAARADEAFPHNAAIFVHGFFGSGAQFESQKLRLVANGYPENHVEVLEYDSLFVTESREDVYERLDALVAELKERTGKPKVDILGHSLGTTLMHEYLPSSEERAANVGHYVNIDGRTADQPPGGVPTLALWAGRGDADRAIAGAQNVTLPNQTHVEAATSKEAFVAFYEFFTGEPPLTPHVVREPGSVEIEGRAVLFPQNRGTTGLAVDVWPIDPETGARTGAEPEATLALDGDGYWEPVTLESGRHYEFALVRPGATTIHYYLEPFVADDHLVRLLYSEAVENLIERSEQHSAGLVLRYKEFWGDQGEQNDILAFNGVNACEPAICPIEKRVIGLFAFDRHSDGQTDLSEPHPVFSSLSFITAADIFLPAARPPTGTTSVSLTSRGGGPTRTLNIPNFASTLEGFSLYFNDFERTVARCLDADGRARGRRLGPTRLGRERAAQRDAIDAVRAPGRSAIDSYCVADGGRFHVGYRRQAKRGAAAHRAQLVATSSRRFRVRGVRAGMRAKRARRVLAADLRIRQGKSTWLVADRRRAAAVARVRSGRVREVGIAARTLLDERRALKRLLRTAGR